MLRPNDEVLAMPTTSHIRLRVEIELDVSTYGTTVSLHDIAQQAEREGLAKLRAMLADKGRMIGTPRVIAVTTYQTPTP